MIIDWSGWGPVMSNHHPNLSWDPHKPKFDIFRPTRCCISPLPIQKHPSLASTPQWSTKQHSHNNQIDSSSKKMQTHLRTSRTQTQQWTTSSAATRIIYCRLMRQTTQKSGPTASSFRKRKSSKLHQAWSGLTPISFSKWILNKLPQAWSGLKPTSFCKGKSN